jgi:integral membrane protein
MPLQRFRFIAILEGISFLTLLCIAMPLKYLAGMPMPVKINGWIHGLLFILYIIFLLQVRATLKWSFKQTLTAFIAAFLPFGTFVLDAKVLRKLI